jgi:hypothetical protein
VEKYEPPAGTRFAFLASARVRQFVDCPAIPFAGRLVGGWLPRSALAVTKACRQVSATIDIVGRKEAG